MKKIIAAIAALFLSTCAQEGIAAPAPTCGSPHQFAESLLKYHAYLDTVFPDGSQRWVSRTLLAFIVIKPNDVGQVCVISNGYVDKDGKFIPLPK